MSRIVSSARNSHTRSTRRTFLKSVAVGLTVVRSSALGNASRPAASDRIVVGMIGCGKMANDYHIPSLLGLNDVQVVAVCDVDRSRRQHAKGRVDSKYGNTDCHITEDYRDIVARDDIDAVCIATPDHWHAIPILDACRAGKDVYCEKPLTLTLLESKLCIAAVKTNHIIFQTGSQQRSSVFGPFRRAVEIIRSGRLGTIRKVTVGVGGPSIPCDLPMEPMEPGLNWDMWLGPAPLRPYNSILSPRGVHNHFPAWRSYREYSGGGHTDMGAHHYDIAQWALDMDRSGPTEIIPPDDPAAEVGVRYRYANGVEIIHGGPSGAVFTGTGGTLRIDRGHLSSNPASIVEEPLGKDDVHLFESPGHHRNWIDCIKSRQECVAPAEAGARTAALIHLGNLAYWHRRPFRWDPTGWQF